MASSAGKGQVRRTFVAGVGMTAFNKPGTRKWDYPDMGKEAGEAALGDAGIPYSKVQAVVASYCYGEPTCGQRVVSQLGLTGVPVFNVNNNCSSGSSALMLARSLVQAGMDCVLAIGFEKMERGLSERFPEKASPYEHHFQQIVDLGGRDDLIPGLNKTTSEVIKMFAYAAQEYKKKHPQTNFSDFVKVAHKNQIHGSQNPKAALKHIFTEERIGDKKRLLWPPITSGMTASTADGGAAAIVCSEDFIKSSTNRSRAVEILAQHMVTDLPSSFEKSYCDLIGFSMAKKAASMCFDQAGLAPKDVDVIEVHDCFSCNELFMYEALGLVGEGKAVDLVRGGEWVTNKSGGKLFQLGKRWVVNPSGGLESKGHPIGATGLAQCFELVTQLRGEAGLRQLEDARVALQHNFGLGSAAVVTLYKKPVDMLHSKL